nr:hypothetical protein [Tanacetum cinerariifolium]
FQECIDKARHFEGDSCDQLLGVSLVELLRWLPLLRMEFLKMFFEKQKLTGINFMEWYRNLQIVLSIEDKLPFLDEPIPALPVLAEGQVLSLDVLNTHSAWVKATKKIDGISGTSSDLERISRVQTGRRTVCKLLRSQNEELYRQLGTSRSCHDLKPFCKPYLGLMRMEYDGFVQNYNMHSMGKTVTELHAMLKLHEQTLPPKEVAPALHAIRAGRIQKNQKKKSHKAVKGNQRKGKAKMGNVLVPALC